MPPISCDTSPLASSFDFMFHLPLPPPQPLVAPPECRCPVLQTFPSRSGSGPTSCRQGKTRDPSGVSLASQSDVMIYVGKNRTPYVQSIESLKGSSYFSSILDKRPPDDSFPLSPIVVDCEESDFQNMMTVLRYRSLEALPEMTDSDIFKLKRNLKFYGIPIFESSPSSPASCSPATSPVHRVLTPRSPDGSSGNSRLAELPEFPVSLADPAKLVLVSCLDDDMRGNCPCAAEDKPSQWALNFYYRHAFCTGCGRPPSSMPPKLFAEMFMAAASYYKGADKTHQKKWSVGGDSTCTLKFLSSSASCSCPCSRQTMWAASTYHHHAFCTQCCQCPNGSALVCILLALRYGGPQNGKRDHMGELLVNGEEASVKSSSNRPTSVGAQRSSVRTAEMHF